MTNSDHAVLANAFNQFSLDDLQASARRVSAYFQPTPIREIEINGLTISLKMETDGPTGAFKVRGVIEYLEWFKNAGKADRTLVTATTGNHGISLAYTTKRMNLPSPIIFVPLSTLDSKIATMESLGAKIEIAGETLDQAILAAASYAFSKNHEYVPSYHPRIVLGHATLGFEIFSELRRLKRVYFPIGVGAGIAGLLIARKLMSNAEIVGVVPESCKAWQTSFAHGYPVEIPPERSIAEGLRTARPHNEVFKFVYSNLDRLLEVPESAIQRAHSILCAQSVPTDPTGAVSLAACLIDRSNDTNPVVMACGSVRDHRYLLESDETRGAS